MWVYTKIGNQQELVLLMRAAMLSFESILNLANGDEI
jgi:hypothetical protein